METKLRIIDLLDNQGKTHIREIAREVKTSYNNVVRNLKILEKEKIITKEKDANLIKINLNNHLRTTSYLKRTHTEKFLLLPNKIKQAIKDFLDELDEKPLMTLVFGSYAKQTNTSQSDLDLLLVFQKTPKPEKIENILKRINLRNNTKISPIYEDYRKFATNFLNKKHEFSKEIRKDIIILIGIEHYYELLWSFQE
jgi:predicted nucleotidyltransferase